MPDLGADLYPPSTQDSMVRMSSDYTSMSSSDVSKIALLNTTRAEENQRGMMGAGQEEQSLGTGEPEGPTSGLPRFPRFDCKVR